MRIPPVLHDIFGESQTIAEMLAILLFGGGVATALVWAYPEMTQGLPLWRSVIAYLLIFDIGAGCIANFTRSTSNYYATRPKGRLLFISVHVHLPLVAWLLGIGFIHALLIWAYTIVGAFVINALKGSRFQLVMAGLLLSMGIAIAVLAVDVPYYFLVVSLLFMLKVLFSFAVDHYHL